MSGVVSFKERLIARLEAAGGDPGAFPLLPTLSEAQFNLFEQYFELLRHWNRRINLTSLPLEALADQTLDRLFVEPLCAARFLDGRNVDTAVGPTLSGVAGRMEATPPALDGHDGDPAPAVGRTLSGPAEKVLRWADLGSGGGSPAIPLRIACPATILTMVESRGRKAAFLREVVRELKLADVEVVGVRAEALPQTDYGAVTVRAVRLDRAFVAAVYGLLGQNGRLILFLPEPSELRIDGFELSVRATVAITNSQIGVFARRSNEW